MDPEILVFLFLVLTLSIFLGFELIAKVPATLHTPLMSGANAISGITIVGAILSAGLSLNADIAGYSIMGFPLTNILGFLAVVFATINVVGGFMVTHRMLEMFKRKD